MFQSKKVLFDYFRAALFCLMLLVISAWFVMLLVLMSSISLSPSSFGTKVLRSSLEFKVLSLAPSFLLNEGDMLPTRVWNWISQLLFSYNRLLFLNFLPLGGLKLVSSLKIFLSLAQNKVLKKAYWQKYIFLLTKSQRRQKRNTLQGSPLTIVISKFE